DFAAATDDDADLDDAIVRRVAAGRLDVEERDLQIAPRRVLRELFGEAADDRPQQVRDARVVTAARKTAATLEREARARATRRSLRSLRCCGVRKAEPVHFLSLPLSWSSRSVQSSRLWLWSHSRPSM